MSMANPTTPSAANAPDAGKQGLDPSDNRFTQALKADFGSAYAGKSMAALLRDNGINIPRKIELKIREQYVSRTAYTEAIVIGILVGIGIGAMVFIYAFDDADSFSFLSGQKGDIERFAFLSVGLTIGMWIGHGSTQGGLRCDPTNQRVIAENKGFNFCIDDSDCTDHTDQGKGLGLCKRGTDHGDIGILRAVGKYLSPLLAGSLLLAAHLTDGLSLSGGHRTMATFFGISVGIIYQVVFSNYHKVHAAPS